jgi:hypothetical protein
MAENNIPFGTPPVGFMQTGNQQVSLDPPIAATGSIFETYPSEISSTKPIPESVAQPFEKSGNAIIGEDPYSNNTDFQPFNKAQNNQTTKYAIFDMFWLINQKFYKKIQPAQNEAHFVVLSFNMSFGNLRVSFFDLTNNSIQNNIVYLENLKRTVSGTIYPATAFNAFSAPRLATVCLEQLFRQIPGASWQLERPVCKIEKNESKLRFTVADPKYGTYFYDFEDWQYHAFLKALEFTYTKGFELTAFQHLK